MSEIPKKYCVYGCDPLVALGVPAHRFPNPDKHPDLFAAWVSTIGDKLKETDKNKIYRNKRVCDHHFDPKHMISGRRLKQTAILSVNLHRVRQTCSTFVQADHSYTRPQRESFQSAPLEDITNLPGPSRLAVDPTEIPLPSESTETTCPVIIEQSQKRKTRTKFDADSLPLEQNKIRTEAPEHDKTRDLSLGHDYVFYQVANGSFKLHRTPATWTEARLICYDEGAELASPKNEALLAAMSAVLLTSRQPPLHVFTGVIDLYSKGFFTSLKGTPLSAMPAKWAPSEPDNVNHGGNCLILQRNGLLLDSKCDDVYPYICYKRQQRNQVNLCGTSDTEYVFDRNTKSRHKIHHQFVSWQEAYATCAREGAYLAILNSDYEAKTLAQLIKSEWIWAHIGFSYWRKDLWMTVHAETLAEAGYEAWATGEPNDWNEERCGSLAAVVNTLVDIDCLDHARPFICEISSSM